VLLFRKKDHPPVPVEIYTRPGCHLCDEAEEELWNLSHQTGVALDLKHVNVEHDDHLRNVYGDHVPVIFVRGSEVCRHRLDPDKVRIALRDGKKVEVTHVSDLARQECVPCRGGVPPLSGEQLEALHNRLGGGWRVVGEHHLEKSFEFEDFATALAFTNRVGALAEQQGHHPDIHLAWGKAKIQIWTHKLDGLTESDFVLAAKIDEVR
jgi:4a-hydroxytetrahydrobiopterin dehydratase